MKKNNGQSIECFPKQIRAQLNRIERRIIDMAISQEQFDADLAALVTSIGALITAVDNLPKPTDPDFTAEDQSVLDAAASVRAELDKLNPPTP